MIHQKSCWFSKLKNWLEEHGLSLDEEPIVCENDFFAEQGANYYLGCRWEKCIDLGDHVQK